MNKSIIYLATNNEHKQEELSKLLPNALVELKLAKDLKPNIDWVENGSTFEENAHIKALEVRRYTNESILADDSGLEVQHLNNQPGIRSARYAGEISTDQENVTKLLVDLAGIPSEKRQAQFVCVLIFLDKNGDHKTYRGVCEGSISNTPVGTNGFGYDSIFIPNGYKQTLAEMNAKKKNKISHRYQAVTKWVQDYLTYLPADEL